MAGNRIILFGGSFDPIHNGHIKVVSFAADYLDAEKVIFIPARRSPHKESFPDASDEDRVEMIKAAIKGFDRFEISDFELNRPDPSYTLDTVIHFKRSFSPATEFFLLVGADIIKDLHRWYKVNDLLRQCNLCVMYRAGSKLPDFASQDAYFGPEMVQKLQKNVIETPLVDISSTDIRSKIASGRPFENLVGEKVSEYIKKNGLYQG